MYFLIVLKQLSRKITMVKPTYFFSCTLLLLFIQVLFSYCKLNSQENANTTYNWNEIIEELNGIEDIHESAKLKHLKLISDLIATKNVGPTKDNIASIKTNRLKLAIAKLFWENKKYLWVEEIYRQIDPRKLNKQECRLLFDLEIASLLKYSDREINNILEESLKYLIRNCQNELKENPGALNELLLYFVNKQLLNEALKIAEILWKEDEFHYRCGELHQSAHRLRWESSNVSHWNFAKQQYEIIEKDYPKSPFLLNATCNLIILQTEKDNTIQISEQIRKKLFPNINNLSIEKTSNLLDALAPKAKEPETIKLLKDWYALLAEKKSTESKKEVLLVFLNEKCGLSLTELALFLNEGKPQNKAFASTFKNARVNQKIQYLVYWNSDWVPIIDFNPSPVGFRLDPKTNISYVITKNISSEPIYFTYEVNAKEKLPDYIYLEIASLEGKGLIEVSFNYDGKLIKIDKVNCTQEKKMVRIHLTGEIKKSKKWQIIINDNSKNNDSFLEISAPIFLTVQSIADLNKRIGE